MASAMCACGSAWLGKRFFDLGGELEGEGVEALREVADVLEEIVVGDKGGDGCEKSGGGGDQGFGDAGRHGAKAGGAGGAEAGEGVNNAPDGAEQADEGSGAGGGGEPGHAFFGAANFFGGGLLHAYGDGLHRFNFCRRWVAGAGDLGLEFPVAGGVDVGERRAGGNESLRIGDALSGAEDFLELIALAANASKEAGFLKNQRPGDQRGEEKDGQNAAGDPAGLRENLENVADVDGGEERRNVCLLKKAKFYRQKKRSTRVGHGQKIRMPVWRKGMQGKEPE